MAELGNKDSRGNVTEYSRSDRFSPEVVAIEARPLPRSVLVSVFVLCALITAGVAWSFLARLERIIDTEAMITTRNPKQLIRPQITSVISAINFRPGDEFKRGDTLVKFDSSLSETEIVRLNAQIAALRLEKLRLVAEVDLNADNIKNARLPPGSPLVGTLQQSIFDKRVSERVAIASAANIRKVEVLQNRTQLATRLKLLDEQAIRSQLHLTAKQQGKHKGYITGDIVFDLQNRTATLELERSKLTGELEQIDPRISLIDAELSGSFATFQRLVREQLENANREIADKEMQLKRAVLIGKRDSVLAEFDGVILEAVDRAKGSVVDTSDVLMSAVELSGFSDLELEATIRPKDIAWVAIGVPVNIKIIGLPATRNGKLMGEVVSISADAVQGNALVRGTSLQNSGQTSQAGHRAKIKITLDKLINLPVGFRLKPGMLAEAEIIVGVRNPYEYFLEPLLEGAQRSMSEAN